jgi:hypothetical protein
MVAYCRKTIPRRRRRSTRCPSDFETTVLPKATRAVNLAAGDGDAALDQMRAGGGRVE